ncbi:Acg family FMN-binding oxidoreductase [Streptomyces sp. NPDC005931]|uniref:Acg family FMN-binding oxidoreductase n=1 Tax=Streptomyces sp. NPDC005931 TaxID=3364737 RepID=UPI00369122DD
MSLVSTRPGHASTYLVRAAVTAPSLYNTQPWFFVAHSRDRCIELHADPARRLPLTDPYGREMVISCGAALFNIRLAMRHLGFNPLVEPFPRPTDPAFLARVTWGSHLRPTEDEERMYGALRQRHTVRGPFLTEPVPAALVQSLREHARYEGAVVQTVDEGPSRRHLAALVHAAEDSHRAHYGYAAEEAHWTRRFARPRAGIPRGDVGLLHPYHTDVAVRERPGAARRFPTPTQRWSARTGRIVLLTTERDGPSDWLRAGQALERILLYAAAQDVRAAFHTEPLEIPRLRTEIRTGLSAGQYPQMILRLGYAPSPPAPPRRPVADVLTRIGSRPPAEPAAEPAGGDRRS